MKIFRKGELAQDYDGPRVAEGIVKYMRGQAGPSATEISTLQEFEKILKTDDVTICGRYFNPLQCRIIQRNNPVFLFSLVLFMYTTTSKYQIVRHRKSAKHESLPS